MAIPEKLVAEVVAEAGAKMADGRYASGLVDEWVRLQPDASRYVAAHADELGGATGVVSVVFHAALLAACFRRQLGRSVRTMLFRELDAVAGGDREATLAARQPALADYLHANVELPAMRRVLTVLALGMDLVT